MAAGRIQCLAISTLTGHVVFERFYEAFSEVEKANIRSAFDAVVTDEALVEDQELVGRFRNGRIAAIPAGELIFFGLGTGEYNELAICVVLRTIIATYIDLFKPQNAALTYTLLFHHWAQTILVIDEICKEGIAEHLEKAYLQKALMFKLPSYNVDSDKGRGLKAMFSSRGTEMKMTPSGQL